MAQNLNWTVTNGCIESVSYQGEQLTLPWGVETADSSAFFSLENGVGYRYQIIDNDEEFSPTSFRRHLTVRMQEGLFHLICEDTILDSSTIRRKTSLTCLEDSILMDFVLRFRFRKHHFPKARISDRYYHHHNTNLYHQFPVDKAELFGPKYHISVKISEAQIPPCMRGYMYVRDHEDEWVMHCRMLPIEAYKDVIKLCNPWAKTRPLPHILTRSLLTIPGLKKRLLYRGEHSPYTHPLLKRINPQCFPMVKIAKGTHIKWDALMTLGQR